MFKSSANVFLFKLIKNKPFYFIGLLFLSSFSAICNLVATGMLIPIFSILMEDHRSLASFELLPFSSDFRIHFNSQTQLLIICFILWIIILFKNIFDYLKDVIKFKNKRYLSLEINKQVLAILSVVNLDYYDRHKKEDILSIIKRKVEQATFAMQNIQNVWILATIITGHVVIMVITSLQLTVVSGLILSCFYLVNKWLLSQVKKARIGANKTIHLLNLRLVEFLSGIRLIKAVANEAQESQAIIKSIQAQDQDKFKIQLAATTIKAITELSRVSLFLVIIIFAYYLYSSETLIITYRSLIYLIVLFRLLPLIEQFNHARLNYINNHASIKTIANFLTKENKSTAYSGNLNLINFQQKIEFQAVTFAYPHHARIILDKVSFSITSGKKTALVGFPGASNSIITDLIARFYHPIEGKILLDGQELSKYNLSSLRKAIAIISSEAFIFNNSLAYNITYGLNNIREVDIIEATKKAQLYDFVQQLPAGLATKIGTRGLTLSKLQKQQISYARAFLTNPQIIILDEPFIVANSNSNNLEVTQKIINVLCRDRTLIIITKHLDLAKLADKIILFNQGKIKEIGNEQQSLTEKNLDQDLYLMKFKTNQSSRQLDLVQKIAKKLEQQKNYYLSEEITLSLNALLNDLVLLNQGLLENNEVQQKILLDESFQSAQNMLASIQKYESDLSQKINEK